jgi:hypothetical protein
MPRTGVAEISLVDIIDGTIGTRGPGWWRYDAGSADLSTVDTTAEVNFYWVALNPSIDPVKDDRFVIATTHVSGTKAFIYDGVNWIAQTAFVDGNLLVAGTVTANALAANSVTANKIAASSVTADKLNVASLSAVSATIGTLQSATTGARLVIQTDKILVYDAAGVVRVKIGNLL